MFNKEIIAHNVFITTASSYYIREERTRCFAKIAAWLKVKWFLDN